MGNFLTTELGMWLAGVATFTLVWPFVWLYRFIRERLLGRMPSWHLSDF